MSKKVFIIHGWDGNPKEGWFPYLKKELEGRGFEVTVPQMPDPSEPRIKNWVPALAKIVSSPNEENYLVGHSMGCQTIARYLETLPENTKVGGAVFVAGFFKRLTNLEDDEVVRDVVNEWFSTPIDFQKIKSHLNKSIAIFQTTINTYHSIIKMIFATNLVLKLSSSMIWATLAARMV